MHITYIMRKGFQFFPPCLAQVLYLNDLGVDLTVYHGAESEYINELLEQRGIEHHVMKFDSVKRGKLRSAVRVISYYREITKILKRIPKTELLWFGSEGSTLFLGRALKERKYVLSVLELYGDKYRELIGRAVKKRICDATIVTACEKHRAAIMYGWYQLSKVPYVLPNKPYSIALENMDEVPAEIQALQGKTIVLYQGVIHPERPLANIAKALNKLNNDNVVFLIMGKYIHDTSEQIIQDAKREYKNTEYIGFIPNPKHLVYTQYAHVGIAVYDQLTLNTLFCAPNKIYEYAKFGVPMLCSQNLGLTETVGAAGAGECVDYTNVDSIVAGLQKIIHDQTAYKDNARRFYDSTNNRETICQILDELKAMTDTKV